MPSTSHGYPQRSGHCSQIHSALASHRLSPHPARYDPHSCVLVLIDAVHSVVNINLPEWDTKCQDRYVSSGSYLDLQEQRCH